MVLLVKITGTFALNYHRGGSYDPLAGAKLHAAMLATNDETRNVSLKRTRRTIFQTNVPPLTSEPGISTRKLRFPREICRCSECEFFNRR
jgi:hypothetical protein